MLDSLCSAIVRARTALLILTSLVALMCAAAIPFVGINTDMSTYLPTDSPMRAGTEILKAEFADPELSTIRVAVEGLASQSERESTLHAFENIEGVEKVTTSVNAASQSTDPKRLINGDQTLYLLEVHDAYSSDTFLDVRDRLDQLAASSLTNHQVAIADDNPSTGGELPLWIVGVAIALLSIILFAMCASWIEPVLFLATIGLAVAINMGTNIVFGAIAEVTASIAAILQLVLSMDYSIILANRYRQERAAQKMHGIADSPQAARGAMTRALPLAFGAITSASVTTVVGLLMLIFMSFQVGADLGIVLAKGVAISMLCTFVVLPGLLVLCDRLIERTAKPFFDPGMKALSRIQYRGRWVIAALFIGILALCGFLQTRTHTVYTLDTVDEVAESFTPDNQIVMLYLNSNAAQIPEIVHFVEDDPLAVSVLGYPTTVGEQHTVEELADTLATFDDENKEAISLDKTSLQFIYFEFHDGRAGTMNIREFASAVEDLRTRYAAGELPMLSDEDAAQLEKFAVLQEAIESGQVSESKLTRQLTPQQMSRALSAVEPSHTEAHSTQAAGVEANQRSSSSVSGQDIEQLYVFSRALNEADPAWTMSLDEFVNYTSTEFMAKPAYAGMVSKADAARLSDSRIQITEAKDEFVGDEFSRLIITTSYPEESAATKKFIDRLTALSEDQLTGEHFFVGNSIMVHEMQGSFGAENLKITFLSAAAIFLIVALTFRSVAVPAVLVLLVQVGVFITVSVIGLQGYDIYYLAMLVVQCILMGATIDYAIVLTTYYRQYRATHGIRESLAGAYEGSIHTILTSGLIMILVTGALGFLFANPTVGQICRTISLGALAAVLLIVCVLPALLAVCDRFITPRVR